MEAEDEGMENETKTTKFTIDGIHGDIITTFNSRVFMPDGALCPRVEDKLQDENTKLWLLSMKWPQSGSEEDTRISIHWLLDIHPKHDHSSTADNRSGFMAAMVALTGHDQWTVIQDLAQDCWARFGGMLDEVTTQKVTFLVKDQAKASLMEQSSEEVAKALSCLLPKLFPSLDVGWTFSKDVQERAEADVQEKAETEDVKERDDNGLDPLCESITMQTASELDHDFQAELSVHSGEESIITQEEHILTQSPTSLMADESPQTVSNTGDKICGEDGLMAQQQSSPVSSSTNSLLYDIFDAMKNSVDGLSSLQKSTEKGVLEFQKLAQILVKQTNKTNVLLENILLELKHQNTNFSDFLSKQNTSASCNVQEVETILQESFSNICVNPYSLRENSKICPQNPLKEFVNDPCYLPAAHEDFQSVIVQAVHSPQADKAAKMASEQEQENNSDRQFIRDGATKNSTKINSSASPQVNIQTTAKLPSETSVKQIADVKEPPISNSLTGGYTQNSIVDRQAKENTGTYKDSSRKLSALGIRIEGGSELEAERLHEALALARVSEDDPPPKARSFDTVLCLDTSESMNEDGAFDEMMDVVNKFIDGVEDVVNDTGVEENIGVVTFGGRAAVAQHLTNDFSRVRDAIDRIEVGGKSPLFEAIVVSLAAFDGRGGTVSVSGEYEVRPRIIVISDGKPTDNLDDPYSLDRCNDQVNVRARLTRLLMDLGPSKSSSMPHPIVFIPVGKKADRILMNSLATLNNSPMVEPEDLVVLCRYFHKQEAIGKVLACLKNKAADQSEDHIRALIGAMTTHLEDNEIDEVMKSIQEELQKPDRKKQRNTKPTDFDDVFENKEGVMSGDRLPLGTRVVRGPDWKWGNQDSAGPGTVIQHEDGKHPFSWVLWDTGEWNRYPYGPDMGYHIWKTEEHPRIKFENTPLTVGMKVQKGPNLDYSDSFQGKKYGVIIRKSKDGKQLKVRWDDGDILACPVDSVVYCDPFEVKKETKSLGETLFGHKLNDVEQNIDQEDEDNGDNVRTWQWRDDWGNWRLYPDDIAEAIETTFLKKNAGSCLVNRQGSSRRVIYRRMVEKTVDTGLERDIQRILIPIGEYESLKVAEELYEA